MGHYMISNELKEKLKEKKNVIALIIFARSHPSSVGTHTRTTIIK